MQKWQAGKEFRDWCAEYKATMNQTSAMCNSTLRNEPTPPPFIRRQSHRVKRWILAGWAAPATMFNRLQDFVPSKAPQVPISPPNFVRPELPSTSARYATWVLTTIIISMTTFFLTVILTTLMAQLVRLDPAHSGYRGASPMRNPLRTRSTSRLVLFLQTAFWGIILGQGASNSTAFIYHVGVGSAVQVAVAWLSSDVNVVAVLLSLAAIIWFANRFQFRRAPRFIGERNRNKIEEFDIRTEIAWRGFHQEALQPAQVSQDTPPPKQAGGRFRRVMKETT